MPGFVKSLQMSWNSPDELDSSPSRTAAFLGRNDLPKNSCSRIHSASWNISAVNNNPFEYWTSNPDPNYDSLMKEIQEFIENPELDVYIHSIFLDSMFSELCDEMVAHKIEGLEKLKCYWTDEYRSRKAVKGFLKDKSIGTKRLASMPDRITNTINLHNGGVCLRPSVMNAYDGGSMSSLTEWWDQWKNFMFRTQVQVFTGLTENSPVPQVVCSLITPILRGKYPAITEEEQAISVPLQILCLAILDAIFVHILNSVSGGTWEATRRALCDALIVGKVPRVCEILAGSYGDCDVVFIQEAAAVFVQDAKRHPDLQARYCTLAPRVLDGKRDQNSLILVSRARFDAATGDDVTQQVLDSLGGAWVAPGDLLVVGIEEAGARGGKWLLASFHGDSNGLSSQPLLLALREIADRDFEDHVLLLGIDANTTSTAAVPGDPTYPQSVHGFAAFLVEQELVSLWGAEPDPSAWTTCSSRTYIQTQLNKAVAFKDRFASSQRNLKDWIIASERQVLAVTDAARDNTGKRTFLNGTVLPTLEFPSDHAIVSAVFHLRPRPAADAGGVGISCKAGDRKKVRIPRPSRLRQAGGREKTLYDYWGIGQKPLAFERENTVGNGSQARRGKFIQGLTHEEELDKFVENHYVHLVESRVLNDLDKQKREYSRSSDRSIWILFSTRPYTMAIRKFWFQIIVAVAGSAFLAQGALNMSSLYKVYIMRARGLRLTATTTRNGSNTVGGPGISGLGLLQNGCRQVDVSETSWMSGTEMLVQFALSVPIDGFWMTTTDSISDFDPGLYNLYRNLDDNSWQPVSPPPWVLQSRMFEIPLKRLAEKHVDFRPPVTWVLSSCVGIPAFSLACYLSCLLGMLGWGRRGAIAISGGFFFLALMQLIWALYTTVVLISDSEDGTWDSLNVNDTTAWTSWLFFLCSIFLAVTAYEERYTLDSFLIVFTLIGAGMVYDAKDRATSSESGLYRASFALIWSILPAITLGILIMARFFTNRWVLKDFLSSDRAMYNRHWESILASDSMAGCLLEIAKIVDSIDSKLESCEARQYLGQISIAKPLAPPLPSSFFSGSLNRRFSLQASLREVVISSTSSSSKFFVSGRTVVTSLDQLMEQAECLNIFLKQKVKGLAIKSSGSFQVTSNAGDSRTFERYTESSQTRFDWVWAATKPSERALEKLLRSYNCDVSKLLDCCRQTIAFESVSDLLECLSAVRADKEIEIVRIKNMLNVKFDSWRTGGFRSLILNIRIRSNATRNLGVDWHVCELQLNLLDIVSSVTESAHSRFLVWRNCRDAPSLWRDAFVSVKDLCTNLQSYKQQSKAHYQQSAPERVAIHSPRGSHIVVSQEPASNILIGSPRLVYVEESDERGREEDTHSETTKVEFIETYLEFHENGNGAQAQRPEADSLQKQLRIMMEEQHRISMTSDTRYDSYLSNGSFEKGKLVEIAVYRAADGSIWDTSYPFAALLCKRWFSRLLCFVILILLSTLAAYLSLTLQDNVVQGYRFRFTALRLRNGKLVNNSGPGIILLGFTKDSCGDEFQHLSFNRTVGNDGTLLMSFAQPVTMNGWWFEIGDQPPEEDPVSFKLERSVLTTGDDWELTGASSNKWSWSGSIKWDTGIYHTTMVRNATERFDLGVPWIWKIHRVSCSSSYLAMAVSILFAAVTKNHLKAKWIAVIFSSITALMNVVACIFYCVWGQWQIGFVAGGCFVIDVALPFILLLAEKYLLIWIGAAGLGYIALNLFHYLALLQMPVGLVGDRGIGFVRNFGLVEGAGYFSLFLFAYITRLQNRRNALSIIKPDWDAYDACWNELNKQESFQATLEYMQSFILDLSYGCEMKVVRQPMFLKFGPNGNTSVVSMQENIQREDGSLLHNLQRLFAQAAGLDIFLRAKVKEWALVCRGFMRVKNSFEKWEHIMARRGESQVQWTMLKSLDRALEKIYRVYNLDASLLLDCCRQSIYFEDIDSLFLCLRTICADKEVKIARICNRLHKDYDAAQTAGYRDVLLNLSIETEETQRLSLSCVICELQLALIGFASIKSDERHARYIHWRNHRGQ